MTQRTLWIGSYTPETGSGGRGSGIYRVELDPETGALSAPTLAAATPSPSWLVRHPFVPVVLAVSEQHDGEIRAFAINEGALDLINSQGTSGAHPCHIALSADADTAIVSNYGDGLISTHRLSIGGIGANPSAPAHLDGEVSAVAHFGSGPDSARQAGPHAHSGWLSPGRDQLLVCDLGTDELRRFDLDEFGRLRDPEIAAKLPAGSGPRHLAMNSNGFLYVNGELDSTIIVLRWDPIARRARQVQIVPAAHDAWSSHSAAQQSQPRPAPSHLELDSAGQFLYAAVRGVNLISGYAVEAGKLTHIGDVAAGGLNPRHFAIVGDFIVVANQDSDSILTLRIDPDTGMPSHTGHSVEVRSSACVVSEPV